MSFPLLARVCFLAGSCLGVAALPLPAADLPPPSPLAGFQAASLDERIILVAPTGTDKEDREIAAWQKRIKANLVTIPNYERLGWAYVAKARRTLDAGYYKLAEETALAMDARFGPSDEALLLRGHVYHNLHQFKEAEAVARELVSHRGLAFDYALLSDALMEQGKLSESVAACEKMMTLHPGLEAYSRAANLRWLTGDLPGAIQAMEAAVRAGSPLDATNAAWTLTRLSSYYLQAGRRAEALATAETAIHLVPDYPSALLARGRALLALGEPAQALGPLERAEKLNPLPEYQWWLADTLRLNGQAAAAALVETRLLSHGEAADPRTLALFLATRRQTPLAAVSLARAELSNRSDAFTEDALAWALAAEGDAPGAKVAMTAALRDHTQDARLYLHAGEIALASGQSDAAYAYFSKAAPYAATLTPSEKSLLDRRRLGAPVAKAS